MLVFLYLSTIFCKNIVPDGCCYASSSSFSLSFYSDSCQKSLLISVSSDFYDKYRATNNFCVSTHNSYCSLEKFKFDILLIGLSFDQFF